MSAGEEPGRGRPQEEADGLRMLPGAGARRSGRASAELDREAAPLRARRAGELVDLAVEVLRGHFLACVGICALMYLPVRLFAIWARDLFGGAGGFDFDGATLALLLGAGFALPLLIQTLATAYVTVLAHDRLVGGERSVGDVLLQVLRRLLVLIVALVLVFVFLMTGMIVPMLLGVLCPPFILVGLGVALFLYWKFSLVPSAIVLERVGVVDSIRRSFELTRGSFLRFLGVMTLQFILVANLTSIVGVFDNPDLHRMIFRGVEGGTMAFDVVFLLISSVLQGLGAALTATVITAFYLDTRIRREGLDLEMRLERRIGELAAGPAR